MRKNRLNAVILQVKEVYTTNMQKSPLCTNKMQYKMKVNIIIVFAAIVLLLGGLVARLLFIEQIGGGQYEKIVLSQQMSSSESIPFRRGDIVDAKGAVLATSVDVYNVILDCNVLLENDADIDLTVAALVECFPEIKKGEVSDIIKEQKRIFDAIKEQEEKGKAVDQTLRVSQYMVLAKQCPYEQVAQFKEQQEQSEEKAKQEEKQRKESQKKVSFTERLKRRLFPEDEDKDGEGAIGRINGKAVWFETEYLRKYPYQSLAASLIGFVSAGNVGTTGLENYYNSTLNGINGRKYRYLNDDNNFFGTTKPAKNGYTISTTIHEYVQSVLEEKLEKYCTDNTDGFVQGDGCLHIAAIAMDPRNGEVLGMANYPTFDLNNPRDAELYFTEEEIKERQDQLKEKQEGGLWDDKELRSAAERELLNELWQNFCVTYAFEPGSTFKPVTIACGLETGILSGDETYVCDGLETISGSDVHCSNRSGHGTETVQQSLMDSCNDALMQMSYSIGKDHFMSYQDLFGFGKKTGIDLPGEAVGQLNQEQKVLDIATNSFGQNFTCTMLQLASAFSSLINGGKYYEPHVVKEILDEEGNVVESIKPMVLKETVSRETSEKIKSYLYATVSEGTGGEAKVDGYSMGGKTGTAQKLPRAAKTYIVSFIGYVPQENPELVLYVIIDEPNVAEQAHSTYAQTVAKDILTEILPYLNIYPDEEKTQTAEDGNTPEGAKAGGQDAPEGSQGSPEGDQGSPEGGQGSPEGDQGASEGGQGSPEGDQGVPEGGQGSPEGDQGSPEGDRGSPEGGDIFEE